MSYQKLYKYDLYRQNEIHNFIERNKNFLSNSNVKEIWLRENALFVNKMDDFLQT